MPKVFFRLVLILCIQILFGEPPFRVFMLEVISQREGRPNSPISCNLVYLLIFTERRKEKPSNLFFEPKKGNLRTFEILWL